ncbi:hypothetical protein ACF1BB_21800 [Streptomyces griseoluteus]|uniref:hypothetical protein n=1 Tax=Streptomyces griseoluteus TaxID=29306 RepID=UPI0036F7FAC8
MSELSAKAILHTVSGPEYGGFDLAVAVPERAPRLGRLAPVGNANRSRDWAPSWLTAVG